MSLADELADDGIREPTPTEAWVAEWRDTLDDADKATFDEWVAFGYRRRGAVASMFRAVERRGYPHGLEAFRRFVKQQRRGTS
jgi:hypothetical protein